MTVELIYARDCPHVANTRANLLRALAGMNLPPTWIELEQSSGGNPEYVRRYGSPTVLVNGHDIATGDPVAALCCRLYYAYGVAGGTPSVELIRSGIEEYGAVEDGHGRIRFRNSVLAMPGIGVALLPKLACPLCWPTYAALLSALGLGSLLTSNVLFWVTGVLFVCTVSVLAIGARTRRGYGPPILAALASAAVLTGKFALESSHVAYTGITLLVAATIWNAWPRPSPLCCACLRSVSGAEGNRPID